MNDAFDSDGGKAADEGGIDTGTIGWLLPEIVHAFDAATAALRRFRAGAAGVERAEVDLGPLRVARSHLHQAHGALELGEIAGVTKLTEAIEEFLADFELDPARCTATALDAIIGGCRAIVEYLEDLRGGGRAQPVALFPSYRDLLVARGADRVHPADLFVVDLSIRPARHEAGVVLDKSTLKDVRGKFEQALLRYIRADDDSAALATLERAVAAIDGSVAATSAAGQSQQRAFWWATRGLFEALAHDGFARNPSQHAHLKRLAGRINLQIRKLSEGSSAVAERLFADVLFFVAIAAPVTPHVRAVQERFRLVGAVPADFETQRYGRIDPVALRSARETLAAAKGLWSAIVAGDIGQIAEFAKHTTALLEGVGAIKRRGLAQVAQVIDGIATDLGFDPRQPSAGVGLDVATALLFLEGALERARALDDAFDERAALVVARVEKSALGREHDAEPIEWLDRMTREAQERLTVATFVVELQSNLRSAEKELDAFFRDPAERHGLAEAHDALGQVSGALALLGHDDVHRAIDHARETIARFQTDDRAIEPAAFEALAQSLGAVGFYVEQLTRDRIDPEAFHFDRETGRFSARMARPANADAPQVVPVAAEPSAASPAPAADAPPVAYSDIAFAATEVLDHADTLEDEIAHRAADARQLAARLRADPEDRRLRDRLAAAVDDVRRNAALIDDRALQDDAAAIVASLRAAGQAPLAAERLTDIADGVAALAARADRSAGVAPPAVAPAAPAVAVPAAANPDAIDAELLDVFLEEAGEVLSDAAASLRVLDADPANATATVNLRRGFHTLKGSSRMVGLTAFGEAAWAVEQRLNAQIADQVDASSDLRSLIEYAIRYLTDWVDELRQHGASSRIPDALIEAARAAPTSVAAPARAGPAEAPEPRALDPQAPDPRAPDPQAPDAEATATAADDAFTKTVVASAGEDDASAHEAVAPATDAVAPATDATAAEAAAATQPEPHDEPLLDWLDFPIDAEADRPAAAEPEPTVAAAASPDSADNVLAFPMRDAGAATDEVRRIGPLTLSVALFNIYLSEADELLRVLTQDFAEWAHELDRFVSERAMRAAHSLAGSSATVGLVAAHDLAAAIEEVLQALYRGPMELTVEQVDSLRGAVEALRRMLHRFASERMPDAEPVWIAKMIALKREIVGAEAGEPTVAEGAPQPDFAFEPLDFDAPIASADTPAEGVDAEPAAEADSGVDAVAGAAAEAEAEAGAGAEAEAGAGAGAWAEGVVGAQAGVAAPTEAQASPVDEPVGAAPPDDRSVAASRATAAADDDDEDEDEDAQEAAFGPFVGVEPDALAVARRGAASDHVGAVEDDLDADLLEVFVAEGNEILPQIGTLLRTWQAHRDNPAPARTLLRHLHTLKGSARMAGAMRLGEVVHDIEARVEAAARLPEVPATLIDELLAAHDRSLELFDGLQQPQPATRTATPSTETAAVAPATAPAARAREPKQPSHQVVRVHSETLDRLVNLAGEVSISRARIENEVLQIKDAMADLADNVERLRGQLREIELQAEFQMQSKMQSQQPADGAVDALGDHFDPLEFDRFTRFQELTRMMAESVNDVKTVQQNLQKSLDAAEVDLTSQRRMTRDLQQDLMQVRMVPFSSIAERLYRVARRAAKEVDKRVNLDIRGGTVEIDRSVLERMAGPFEHLLRNHIVHGIESRDVRRQAGKSEIGELLVEIRQEGNEIVLIFSDDGAGLDRARIREKGRALGLIGDDATDAQVTDLIFHPGFSTATEVTELAGRGVGMEVVRAEALELAGRVTVDSEAGRGARFRINLPLTLAVTQVVLVAVANRVYALPAVLVEQVRQMRQQPLADAYRAGQLDDAGTPLPLSFLGSLLGIEDCVPVAQRTSPVLVLRSAGERVAIHVDEVVGNQEVVVKNLGPQLARMAGIAGATVLGSGEIVLILNPVPLALAARAAPASGAPDAPVSLVPVVEAELKTLPTVMVVDDSLTVRRVTQRLLSREGYQVVLAKDGVDALEQLQAYPPDVMLVDIEMPRMDGFDLTRNVRNDERYRTIPIIMITSRTAEKHRRHAAALGVDAYLGKPYQEDELLELLAMHVREGRGQMA